MAKLQVSSSTCSFYHECINWPRLFSRVEAIKVREWVVALAILPLKKRKDICMQITTSQRQKRWTSKRRKITHSFVRLWKDQRKGPPNLQNKTLWKRNCFFFRAIIILRGKRPRERERAPLAKWMILSLASLIFCALETFERGKKWRRSLWAEPVRSQAEPSLQFILFSLGTESGPKKSSRGWRRNTLTREKGKLQTFRSYLGVH